jgi:hypothetical protein
MTILEGILSTSNFITKVILIYWCRFQISKVCHIFKAFISSRYVVIVMCSGPPPPHTHTFFSEFALRPKSLPAPTQFLRFSLHYISLTVSMLLPYKLASMGCTTIWYGPFNFSPSWFTCIFLVACSRPMAVKQSVQNRIRIRQISVTPTRTLQLIQTKNRFLIQRLKNYRSWHERIP